ncbi:unnamed protein product [Cuscuta epithymum]|uniref:Uncharacterized protein n=1 Tax=Cuscuta epithymum TaxID=186058 RepID=A0AAV0FF83_9ASTE|nr:unnamed protein product [Cuscuta epithymum]
MAANAASCAVWCGVLISTNSGAFHAWAVAVSRRLCLKGSPPPSTYWNLWPTGFIIGVASLNCAPYLGTNGIQSVGMCCLCLGVFDLMWPPLPIRVCAKAQDDSPSPICSSNDCMRWIGDGDVRSISAVYTVYSGSCSSSIWRITSSSSLIIRGFFWASLRIKLVISPPWPCVHMLLVFSVVAVAGERQLFFFLFYFKKNKK